MLYLHYYCSYANFKYALPPPPPLLVLRVTANRTQNILFQLQIKFTITNILCPQCLWLVWFLDKLCTSLFCLIRRRQHCFLAARRAIYKKLFINHDSSDEYLVEGERGGRDDCGGGGAWYRRFGKINSKYVVFVYLVCAVNLSVRLQLTRLQSQ